MRTLDLASPKSSPVSGCLKALAGLILILLVHLPRLAYLGLLVSYAAVFQRRPGLTASPREHLARAKKLLKRDDNSVLLYAALEIRFALERMARWQVVFAEKISNRVLDDPDPVKKLRAQRRLDPATDYPHHIYARHKESGDRFRIGEYRPMDIRQITKIHGRLGDLLHPKEGLLLGLPDNPWYRDTRTFLGEAHDYLVDLAKDNDTYFAYADVEHVEMERADVLIGRRNLGT